MARDKKRPGEWGVYDLNARQIDPENPERILPRVHEPVLGVTYPLTFNTPCWMPQAHARVFLKDPAFKVVDNDEIFIPPLVKEALLRATPEDLPPNLVIADLNELTDEALLTRAAQRQGGGRFMPSTPRDTLLEFLQRGLQADAGPAARIAGPTSPAASQDTKDAGDVEELSDAEADALATKMLEGE